MDLDNIEDSLDNFEGSLINDNTSVIDEISYGKNHTENLLDSSYIDENSTIDYLNELIKNIYNCEYNSNELFTIAQNILFLTDYLDNTLDSVELQLEAYHECHKKPLHPTDYDLELIY